MKKIKKVKKVSNIKNILIKYIVNNSKEYILVILIFIIGLFVGVMFVNNCSISTQNSITSYIQQFIENFKNIENINSSELLRSSLKSNIILAFTLWFAGTTIIGLPVVIGIILFRAFSLGYTIASITYTLGTIKGILFCIEALFFQNILFIPALLTMGVSSIKLYKSIIRDRRKENIKYEVIRHTIISIIMIIILLCSTLLENKVSVTFLKNSIKYF